ncbi:MAG TPA: hypothetical protein VHY19_02815 [Steroidobacteraceae bacterium]|jgi:hypothetical protein|nr:hypothetical protein [Steroidobacteraceae bacterium]
MVMPARDVVLIPCWRRPEFLWHCLDNLARAAGIDQLHVLFRADTGYDRAIHEVIAEFASHFASYQVDEPVPCPYKRSKQSANVLGGYLLAAQLSRRYVFMVEEDIMVARDFLRWHYAVQAAQPRLFCSIATRNTNRNVPDNAEPEIYYLTSADYCSLGVCFERSVIGTLIAPHVTRAYFADPRSYCERTFPGSRLATGFEQDGLIRRIQESEGDRRPIAYAYRPRGFHAGFFGYHRPGSVPGDLTQRIGQVGEVIYNVEAMRAAANRPEAFYDSVPVPLETPPWQSLRFQALTEPTETPA